MNLFGSVSSRYWFSFGSVSKSWEKEGKKVQIAAIGTKGFSFMNRVGADVKSNITGLGDTPHLNDLIGSIKVMLDSYINGEIDQLYICFTKFINTMKQEPIMDQVLPLNGEKIGAPEGPWDYIYEPTADAVIEELLKRYIESIIYHCIRSWLINIIPWPFRCTNFFTI